MATAEKRTPDDPPTEVVAKARRRTFTARYKLKILKRADACEAHGALGALLRKEGLYSSHLTHEHPSFARGHGQVDFLEPAHQKNVGFPPLSTPSVGRC
jgi:hypothetical protein